jgi:predicted DCC family thiol-disulfide oxidoreductase YuxK
MSEKIVVFNGNCPMCADLARQIEHEAGARIRTVSLTSEEGKSILKRFYPDGHPFSYFLVEEVDGRLMCHKGTGVVLRLASILPLSGSIMLLYTYMHYRAHGSMATNRIISPIHEEIAQQDSDPQRRYFLRVMFAGGLGLVLASIGLANIGSAQANVVKIAPQQAVNAQSTGTSKGIAPDCIDYGCACGSGSYCYHCLSDGNCYQCCQLLPTCNFNCTFLHYGCGYPCMPPK